MHAKAEEDARYLALIRSLSPSERFGRTLALSAFVRGLTWEGAARHEGERGARAVTHRFLLQMYGSDLAEWVTAQRVPPQNDG